MEWFAILIPIVGILVAVRLWPHRMTRWELLLPCGVCVPLIFLGKIVGVYSQTNDWEYWTSPGTQAEYYEDWNERVSCRHPRYKTVSDGKGGTKTVSDGYEHAYDVDYHPPYWELVDDSGNTVSISSEKFETLAGNRWRNRRFVELHRDYHTDDGDKYVTTWDGSDERMEVVTTLHRYENRPQAANSVFNYPDVTDEDKARFSLVEYPEVTDFYHADNVLGAQVPRMAVAERKLSLVNARLGGAKQIRIFLILYKNQPLDASFAQESLWKGGNKNELVLTMGLNSENKLTWARVFSWSDVEEVKVRVRNLALEQMGEALDLERVIDGLTPLVTAQWRRKSFSDFDYLRVDPPLWSVVLTYLLTMAATCLTVWWCVENEHSDREARVSL